jgi:putative DNA primase/helicase
MDTCTKANRYDDTDRARDALYSIPPDLPHDQWVKTGMAAHAAGLGFDDFDQWSAPAGNYNAQASRATWRSFKTAPGGVGAGALFGMARDNGWLEGNASTQPAPARATPKPTPKPAPTVNADAVWSRCEPATAAHAYIAQKQGNPQGLRVVPDGDPLRIMGESMAGALVVPCMAADGTLSTMQLIPPPDVAKRLKAAGKPGKLNLPGCRVKGWFAVGELAAGGTAYIVEGIGQAWACWQATGAAAMVCFGVCNMGKVATALRQKDDTARLVICPDRGKEKDAHRIAAELGCTVACLPESEPDNFDVNDLFIRDGFDALAAMLESATMPLKPEPLLKPVSVADVVRNPSQPPSFVWDGYLPRGVVSMLGAHGGTGKSTIALMLAVSVALGRSLFGVNTQSGKAVFVSLEDGTHIVRHRLAHICQLWGIDPLALSGRLLIVDGTANPELFAAETRGDGAVTETFEELRTLAEGAALVVVDNASDAFGGDEIQRRQVRAFIRALGAIAKASDCSVLLLAHVNKATSRERKAEGGEGYSGSTAWHNSVRSRLFMTRGEDGLLTLEHQKSNLGQMREPLTLEWPDSGLPQLVQAGFDGLNQRQQGRADDDRAASLISLIAEFESRGQYCSPAITSRNHVFAVLKSEPAFQNLKLRQDDTKRIVNQCQRAGWIEPVDYKTPDRKPHQRWTVTAEGRAFSGLSAPTAPTAEDGACQKMAQGGAPTAPTSVGGMGERVHTQDGAEESGLVNRKAVEEDENFLSGALTPSQPLDRGLPPDLPATSTEDDTADFVPVVTRLKCAQSVPAAHSDFETVRVHDVWFQFVDDVQIEESEVEAWAE